jgi:hypothetical protein
MPSYHVRKEPAMAKRKRTHMPKRLRFDVFKRDQFTCQYCGLKAPEVVLQIDHITPVALGGGNDILNLRTACTACNAGKSDKPLSENATIDARRKQLEELEERRQQLDMMHEWHLSLADIDHKQVRMAEELWFKCLGKEDCELIADAFAHLQKVIRKYGFDATCSAIRIATNASQNGDKSPTEMFWKLGSIIVTKQRCDQDPDLKRLYYIRAIVRNRCPYIDDRQCMILLGDARTAAVSLDKIEDVAKRVRSWEDFREIVETMTELADIDKEVI